MTIISQTWWLVHTYSEAWEDIELVILLPQILK